MTITHLDSPKRSGASRGGRISKKVWIRASPETVYSALTESRELVRWFCDRASCNPREGGELVAHWKTGKSSRKGRAVFARVVPNSLLEMVWSDDGCGARTGVIADFNKDDIDYSYYVAAAKKLLINNTPVDEEVAAYL